MTKVPLVSIITPSYNQGQFLETTIQSVINQNYPQIEYLVIDGGSSDTSLDIILAYAQRLAFWVSEPDQGQSHAINKGLERSRGDILGWLNSDDLLFPDTVSLVVDSFSKHPEIDVIYGHLERIDDFGSIIPTPSLPKDRVTFSKNHIIGECLVNQPGSFWRRKAMERVGLLDPNLHYGMDYEYWIRLALDGARFLRLPETLAYFRLSAESKTVGQTALMALEQLAILDRILDRDDLSQVTGLSMQQIKAQAHLAKSQISLHAFYGYLKQKQWTQAVSWLGRSFQFNPLGIFRRKWLDLALARIKR